MQKKSQIYVLYSRDKETRGPVMALSKKKTSYTGIDAQDLNEHTSRNQSLSYLCKSTYSTVLRAIYSHPYNITVTLIIPPVLSALHICSPIFKAILT